MFVLISELTLFLSIIGIVIYNFNGQKEISNMDQTRIKNVLKQVVGSDYKSLTINSTTDKNKKYIYEEYIFKYETGTLDKDICDKLTK